MYICLEYISTDFEVHMPAWYVANLSGNFPLEWRSIIPCSGACTFRQKLMQFHLPEVCLTIHAMRYDKSSFIHAQGLLCADTCSLCCRIDCLHKWKTVIGMSDNVANSQFVLISTFSLVVMHQVLFNTNSNLTATGALGRMGDQEFEHEEGSWAGVGHGSGVRKG